MAKKQAINLNENLLARINTRIARLNESVDLGVLLKAALDSLITATIQTRDQLEQQHLLLQSLSQRPLSRREAVVFEKSAEKLLEMSADDLLTDVRLVRLLEEVVTNMTSKPKTTPKVRRRQMVVEVGSETKSRDEPENGRRKSKAKAGSNDGKKPKGKTVLKTKPKGVRGLDPYSYRIFPAVFSQSPLPTTLDGETDGVLATTYGPEWKKQKIGGIPPGGRMVGAKMGDAVALVLLRSNYLAAAHLDMLEYFKHPRRKDYTERFKEVYRLVLNHPAVNGNIAQLSAILHGWGVVLKVPKN